MRENVQNAYDAVLMRALQEGRPISDFRIEVVMSEKQLIVRDDGIGMTKDILENSFWRAGRSGKNTQLAQQAGVIGTFGIGGLANFGVCTALTVETEPAQQERVRHRTSAERDKLELEKDCVAYESLAPTGSPGTQVTATIDPSASISTLDAKKYLVQFVQFICVPVSFNGEIISQRQPTQVLGIADWRVVGDGVVSDAKIKLNFSVREGPNRRLAIVSDTFEIMGEAIEGGCWLVQDFGALFGLRNRFGLAQVPTVGFYSLGGYINLKLLSPTAGREALQRESVSLVQEITNLLEMRASELVASTEIADGNRAFLSKILASGRIDLAGRVRFRLMPEDELVEGQVLRQRVGARTLHYYQGLDAQTIQTFASGDSALVVVSQEQPRRTVQWRYLREQLKVDEVPDVPTVGRIYEPRELTIDEIGFLSRIKVILADDYLVSDPDVHFAVISHGLTVYAKPKPEGVLLYIARDAAAARQVIQAGSATFEVFGGLAKDFVRNHVYQKIGAMIPSSTRQGMDALYQMLERNKELYRLEAKDRGDVESLFADYLTGNATLAEVLTATATHQRAQAQTVAPTQVAPIEQVMPDVVAAVQVGTEGEPPAAMPAIAREDMHVEYKVLTVEKAYPQLNGFLAFLALSDRLFRFHAEFFKSPHTTRVIWAGHRILYVFSWANQELALYYDIELRESVPQDAGSGGAIPTTTILTQNRVFVPVPQSIDSLFRVKEGRKEFQARFDTIP